VILRCLRKDPQRRFQHLDDVKVALQEIKEESESGAAAVAIVPRRHSRSLRLAAVAGSLILVAGLGAWLLRSSHGTEAGVLRVVPLTNFKGVEDHPTFSPDGQQVAFVWDGEREDNYDIYVKLVGSPEVRRLTSDPAADITPRWSPNGQEIAFVRNGLGPAATVHVVSPLGGADREVSDFSVAMGLDWSPDGHWIVVGHIPVLPSNRADNAGIYLIPLDGGDPRLIVPAESHGRNELPTFAPDARHLAYSSCSPRSPDCTLDVVEVDAAYKPVAAPRHLVLQTGLSINALAWTRDGRSIIVSAWDKAVLNYLWRVAADGSRPPERIEVAGLGAGWPATVFSRDRLAFVRDTGDVDLYRFVPGRPPEVVAASSFLENYAAVSADGRRVAFSSTRSTDAMQVWVSGVDGSDPRQLTHGERARGSPSWSPDGHQIAFDSFDDDAHYHIWIMDADGAHQRQVTSDAGDQNMPTWSADGRWIYFSWDQGGERDLWRMPAGGGLKQRLTREGAGFKGRESADGQSLVYQSSATGALLAVSLSGGSPHQLIPCVTNDAFDVAAPGIYYVPCSLYATTAQLHVMEPSTGADRLLGPLEKLFRDFPMLSVSRDGRVVLYDRYAETADLMLIENFR